MSRLVLVYPLAAAGITFGVMPAAATSCRYEIARLEVLAHKSGGAEDVGPSVRQSIRAQLHYQPTERSVKHAEARAIANVERVLQQAKAFDAAGRKSKCMRSVEKAKLLLGL